MIFYQYFYHLENFNRHTGTVFEKKVPPCANLTVQENWGEVPFGSKMCLIRKYEYSF